MPGASSVPYGNVGLYTVMSLVLSPAAAVASTSAEQTFTLPGVKIGDVVIVQKPTYQAGLYIGGSRVTAKDTVGVAFGNFTAVNITPTAAELYTFVIIRYENQALQNPPSSLG